MSLWKRGHQYWTDFMVGATRGRPVEDFGSPFGTSSREVCAETGLLATEGRPNVTTELFNEGSEPADYCTTHPGRPVQTYSTPSSVTATPPRPLPEFGKPDLRDLDRNARARSREKIRSQ